MNDTACKSQALGYIFITKAVKSDIRRNHISRLCENVRRMANLRRLDHNGAFEIEDVFIAK